MEFNQQLDRVKQIWYLSPMRAAKVQARLRIRSVSPEPSLLAHTNSESRGTFRQKARSLAPLNGWAYAVKICDDGMLKDANSLDGAQLSVKIRLKPRTNKSMYFFSFFFFVKHTWTNLKSICNRSVILVYKKTFQYSCMALCKCLVKDLIKLGVLF